MRVLVDTHAIVWWFDGHASLSKRAREIIDAAGADAFVSVASIWEASIKRASGKMTGRPLRELLARTDIALLRIDERHAELAGELPLLHKDPFDRLLVAQALVERMSIVTVDEHIPKYGVTTIW